MMRRQSIRDSLFGKRLEFANLKITIFKFGKSTISTGAMFNSELLNYQRVLGGPNSRRQHLKEQDPSAR